MAPTEEVLHSGPGLGHERLEYWLESAGLGDPGAPLEVARITGGSQNEILDLRKGDWRVALRKPPANPPPGRAEGILREWKVLQALAGSDVPHAYGVAVCEDPAVLGVPFYLMELVDGWSPMTRPGWWPPFDEDRAIRSRLAFQAVDGLARLSKVDWMKRGLVSFGKPDGFHERQVSRWLQFLERVQTRPLPGLDEATRWLQAHRPIDFVPGIMHGDYQFANLMFRHGDSGQLAAIIDWEMATIGDPKLDFAWFLQIFERPGEPQADSYVALEGMPPIGDLITYYAERSERQVDDIDYYLVLAAWKLGIVLEQGYTRAIQGEDSNDRLLGFGPSVLRLISRAADLAESSSYTGPPTAKGI